MLPTLPPESSFSHTETCSAPKNSPQSLSCGQELLFPLCASLEREAELARVLLNAPAISALN